MKKIPLTQGKFALVDDEDFDVLNKFKWCCNNWGYAMRNIQRNGIKSAIIMHREIMNTPKGMDTDHIDHNKLNNQKNNLRICTRRENQRNRKKNVNGTSKFKGVYATTEHGYKYYVSHIIVTGKRLFKTFPQTPEGEIEAAKWYNEQAEKHHGEFALFNQIPP